MSMLGRPRHLKQFPCQRAPEDRGDLRPVGPELTVVVRCDPVIRGPDVAPDMARGHELGRRVRARRSAEMLSRWRSSAHLSTDRCCP